MSVACGVFSGTYPGIYKDIAICMIYTMRYCLPTLYATNFLIENVYMYLHVGDHAEQFANLWFTMMDSDSDEEISFEEWMKFNIHFEIDRDHAAKSFDALDEDKDGAIDRVEFVRNYIEFCRGTNENHPSRLMFGPI